MKTIKCGVRCEYWNQVVEFTVEVEDDATEEQIEAEMLSAAIEASGLEYWREDE